jgi:hypothetical protein
MAARAAKVLGVPDGNITVFPYIGTLGPGGGPARNEKMIATYLPNLVIAFHRNIVSAKGTRDCFLRAAKRGIPTIIVEQAADVKAITYCGECGGWYW